MSETTTRPVSGLAAMKLDELKGVASSMGIKGTTKMRKSDLVEAIKARQSGGAAGSAGATAPAKAAEHRSPGRRRRGSPGRRRRGSSGGFPVRPCGAAP